MKKTILWIQTLVLLGGSIFAWQAVYHDFARLYDFEGTIFRLTDCAVPHPITTPCFYGALAFVVALVWSVMILRKSDPSWQRTQQLRLLLLLIAGTLFAWTVNGIELWKFYHTPAGELIGCSGLIVNNPYVTSCFIGASIFALSLIAGIMAHRQTSK